MTAAAPSPAPAKRRVRPWVRRLAIAAFVTLVPIAAWSLWDGIEARRLGHAIGAIRSTGAPVTDWDVSADRSRTGSAGASTSAAVYADDAAPYYTAAAALALAESQTRTLDTAGPDEYAETPTASLLLEADDALAAAGGVSPQVAATIANRVGRNRDALAWLDRATTRVFRGFPPGTAYGDRGTNLEALYRLTALRTVSLSLARDASGAAAWARAELHLVAGRLSPLPYWPPTDDRVAESIARLEFVLEETAPSDQDLASIDHALAPAADDEALTWYLMTMRAEAIDGSFSVLGPQYGNAPVSSRLPRETWRSPLFWIGRPIVAHELMNVLAAYAQQIDASREPWPARIDAVAAAAGGYPGGFSRVPLRTVAPQIVARLAEVRSARTAVAVERYRRAHEAALPASLDAVIPAFLPSVPIDPFSGSALRYRRTSTGYVVYSVGLDRRDDGGRLTGYEPLIDGGSGWPPSGGDIGLRIGR